MKPISYIKTETFYTGYGKYLIDRVTNTSKGIIDYWLYSEDYGMKSYIYGVNLGEDIFPSDEYILQTIEYYEKDLKDLEDLTLERLETQIENGER